MAKALPVDGNVALDIRGIFACAIKENFTQFWRYRYKGFAKRFFGAWAGSAMRSRLEPIKKVGKMLRRHETRFA